MIGTATGRLNRWDKCALALIAFVFCALGFMVEYRSAFLTRRMGDLDVFLRAAWAVRAGEDLYSVTSDNDWHYLYPPLYAILMTPLADPPRGHEDAGYVIYPVSVAICFLINVLCLFAGVHVLANALDEASPKYSRRWWWLRLAPIVVCFLPIGHTLMRGQANVVVLATLCAALAGWMRGQNFRAGLWLALAICIKVIPLYLLVYPIWKRDWRSLAGCLVGLVVGLALIPGLTFGPSKSVEHYQTYGREFFAPFLKERREKNDRDDEILGGVNKTESVGVRNALHNWMHPDIHTRPADLTLSGKVTYVVLGFTMTFLTLYAGSFLPSPMGRGASAFPPSPFGRGAGGEGGKSITPLPKGEGSRMVHPFASLILLMALFSPVCHSHYLLFALPIVMCLIANAWQSSPALAVPGHLLAIFSIFFWTMAIAYLPNMEILKDRCAALFATLPLWALPIVQSLGGVSTRLRLSGTVPPQAEGPFR